ncbi:MAG TPA: pirin family protein [Vicinamibacterales bacterium]|nr:pirin family protein [Vicinamibacterales bacterium]
MESFPARETRIGDLVVARALPIRERRMVGPWCFLDRYGPLTFSAGRPMDVAPHPHIGLQTVTWLLDGEVEHDDSLGNQSLLRPDGVNVMTSGGGIAHAEQTPRDHSGRLNGVQLWTALPDDVRDSAAGFAHVDRVPAIESRGGIARIFAGTLGGATSPAPYFSPIVGADLLIHAGHILTLPLDPAFEHAVLVLDGDAAIDGEPLAPRMLHYLGLGRGHADFVSATGGRVLLIGGAPFQEKILMWWNFVARTPEEIAAARTDWESHRRFGEVTHYRGDRLEAPKLVQAARPTLMS